MERFATTKSFLWNAKNENGVGKERHTEKDNCRKGQLVFVSDAPYFLEQRPPPLVSKTHLLLLWKGAGGFNYVYAILVATICNFIKTRISTDVSRKFTDISKRIFMKNVSEKLLTLIYLELL